MNNTKFKPILCVPSTNEDNNSFVGVRIRSDNIEFHYPESYNISGWDEDKSCVTDIKELRKDIIAILHTISLAKSRTSASQLTENGLSHTYNFALVSYLWIIKDFLANGIYRNKEKLYKNNSKGKVNWKKTLQSQPIISNGNIIYNNLVVEVKNDCDTIITDAHRFCLFDSVRKIGWLFGIPENAYYVAAPSNSLKKKYVTAIKQEIAYTFDDIKKIRLNHMLKVLSGVDDSKHISEIVYGVDKYHYIYERMVDALFGNVKDIETYNPNATWNVMRTHDKYSKHNASSLRPDTLHMDPATYIVDVKTRTAYILDAKYYRYGTTGVIKDLPETTSIQKQVTYGDNIIKNFGDINVKTIRSAFILPFNKGKNDFAKLENPENRNMIYLGFAKANWRNGDEHEVIHAFLIDTKHLISSWSYGNHQADINSLIEDIQKYYDNMKDSWTLVSDKN